MTDELQLLRTNAPFIAQKLCFIDDVIMFESVIQIVSLHMYTSYIDKCEKKFNSCFYVLFGWE